ncbi:MAG: hypothetical protein LBK47_08205 [Prevotellaceae bacterium]|nr:hypothetical protein [Prevotellaceae bacterium]
MRKILIFSLFCCCTSMYAQKTLYEIPCQIYDDEEYITGVGISKVYADTDTENAALLAKRDALSEAIAIIALKREKVVEDKISYGAESGMNNSLKSVNRSASKDTFDLDDFKVVCLKMEQTKDGIAAYIAVRISKNHLGSKENNKIRNLAITETVSEIYTTSDDGKDFADSESGLQVTSFYERQTTEKMRTKMFFNPSGAKKFYEMAAQEGFDDISGSLLKDSSRIEIFKREFRKSAQKAFGEGE